MDQLTNNKSLIQMATGTASGQWGAVLNASMIGPIDQSLGNTVSVTVNSSNVNLTTSQIQNLAFNLTGVLTGDRSITLPLTPNSTTTAVGGFFVVDNETSGAFGLTVKTIATGSVGVQVPQGVRSIVYSDGINVSFADDAQNQTVTYNGNPNGNVAGKAGSASTRVSRIVDRTTNIEYLATTSGTASNTVWSANLPFSFASQGYLTASSDATNPVLTADSIGATTIYYTAFRGNLMFIYNGVSFVPVPITAGQMALALSSSFQGANNIYDVIGFLNGTTPQVGFSPAWATPTAGSGARGTGAGTPQLSRVNGILVNTVQQTVNNGATTYTVAANRGTYLGSVSIDSSAGQVTCHRTYGQSRKFGVWNAYNRLPISLKGGDATASWAGGGAYPTFRAADNNSSNKNTAFVGLNEETIICEFMQQISLTDDNRQGFIGIGQNSTSTPTGFVPTFVVGISGSNISNITTILAEARATLIGTLGVTNVQALEAIDGAVTYYGTETHMLLSTAWNG